MGWLLPLLAGTATGILSGFGVGGGTLLLIYMTTFAGVPQNLAQGVNLLYFLPAAATALPAHIKNGYIDGKTVWPAALAGLAGTALAAWLATGAGRGAAPPLLRRIPPRGGPAGAVRQNVTVTSTKNSTAAAGAGPPHPLQAPGGPAGAPGIAQLLSRFCGVIPMRAARGAAAPAAMIITGPPPKPQRSGFGGERRHSGGNELCRLR